MQFKDIIGQQDVKTRLTTSVKENRISHAQLFFGPEGSGSLALAIAYSQFINCTNRTETDSCGECPSCKKFKKLIHPDLHFVYPVATTAKVKKDPVSDNFITQWRECLTQQPYISLNQWLEYIGIENKQGGIQKSESSEIIKKLNLKTYEAEYKTMIIWMPEKMNETCANKLLKILEEPPAKTLFILVTENPGQIIQTILSRTQLVKVSRIDNESLTQRIKQEFDIDGVDLHSLIHNASGNYNKAVKLLNQDADNKANFEHFTTLMRLSFTKRVIDLNALVDVLATLGREKQKMFLDYSLKMIRENFILNQKCDKVVYLFRDEAQFSSKFHPYIHEGNIAGITKEFNEAMFHIERNGNPKIIFFDLSLKLIILLKS